MKFKKLFNLKQRHRRAPRANNFLLESLEPRLLLSATPMTAAVVMTDHQDYAPGETAVITTSNQAGDGLQFAAGEMVRFQITRTDGMADYSGSTAGVGPTGNEAWYVVDGVGGFAAHRGSDVSGDGVADWIAPDNDLTVNSSISTTWFVEEQYRNSSLLVTAAGQESWAVASHAFTDANINTSTAISASTADRIYGEEVTFTATVTAAAGSIAPVGTVEFFDGGTSLGFGTFNGGVGLVSTFTRNIATLTAGLHGQIRAVFTGGVAGPDSYNNSTSGNVTVNVSQATVNVSGFTGTYDGLAHGAIIATGVFGEDLSAGLTSGTVTDVLDSGAVIYTYTDSTGNYQNDSNSVEIIILEKELTGSFAANNKVYDGTTDATVQGTSLSEVIPGDVVTLDGGIATFDNVNAGINKTVTLNFAILGGADASNYILFSGDITTTASITAKAITGSFTADNKVYDGTNSATVVGRSLSGFVEGDQAFVNMTGGTATFNNANAGIGKTVTLTGATLSGLVAGNYNLASVNTSTANIAKADATINVSGFTGVYDAAAHGATGSATGVGGVNLNAGLTLGASFTDAPGGIANWAFTGGTNYTDANGSVAIVITQATATITGTALNGRGYLGVYDAQAHAATATVRGVGGVILGTVASSTTATNVGVTTHTVTFLGDINYKAASKVLTNTITQATVTITGNALNGRGYLGVFDGQAHAATGTVRGVGGVILGTVVSSTTATNVGVTTHTVDFLGNANYKAATKNLIITIL